MRKVALNVGQPLSGHLGMRYLARNPDLSACVPPLKRTQLNSRLLERNKVLPRRRADRFKGRIVAL
jgi:hypothetical protein